MNITPLLGYNTPYLILNMNITPPPNLGYNTPYRAPRRTSPHTKQIHFNHINSVS